MNLRSNGPSDYRAVTYTDTVEHKYTQTTVFLNNQKKTTKNNNMKYTRATQFDICQMTNRTDLYNNWTSLKNTPRMKKINNCYTMQWDY